jgi:tetratricopeptide (TPR) repeat protein
MSSRYPLLTLALATCLVLAAGPAPSAMEPEPIDALTESDRDFARGRQAVQARDWDAAIKAFHVAEQRNGRNAEIQNMLGYAYRNAGKLDVAFKHYQRALQIDPLHRWAHEYIGEAYLMAKNPAKAEEHLAILRRICPSICEERDDLVKKIEQYRARNN